LTNLANGLESLFDLLKKNQRTLQIMSLECLEAITRRYSSQFKDNTKKINDEVSALMVGDDL